MNKKQRFGLALLVLGSKWNIVYLLVSELANDLLLATFVIISIIGAVMLVDDD